MAIEINLSWQGPYGLATPELRERFAPPSQPGVYLWTVGQQSNYHVSYIGKANDLKERMYQHVTAMLGGAYHLYDEAHMVRGEPPKSRYQPGLANFLKDFDTMTGLAHLNLASYRFFWAVLEQNTRVLEAVESALITDALRSGEHIQNGKVSRGPSKSKKVHISCQFPSNLSIRGIRTEYCPYGDLE